MIPLFAISKLLKCAFENAKPSPINYLASPLCPTPPFSDYGFKLSEDLSLQVCVPDPEFTGDLYAPPVPCPVGTTYRRSKG